MIKTKSILLLLAILGVACFLNACNGNDESAVEAERKIEPTAMFPTGDDLVRDLTVSRNAMAKLGKALKLRLQEAMQTGGVINALEVCKVNAVPITDAISVEEGVIISRTSLRIRNPDNTPDNWEHETLKAFETRLTGGEEITSLDAWTIIADAKGQRIFRYMKAIPTAPLCLNCHGEDMASDVSAKLTSLYPADEAVGYAAGEIRGAFTVTKPLLN